MSFVLHSSQYKPKPEHIGIQFTDVTEPEAHCTEGGIKAITDLRNMLIAQGFPCRETKNSTLVILCPEFPPNPEYIRTTQLTDVPAVRISIRFFGKKSSFFNGPDNRKATLSFEHGAYLDQYGQHPANKSLAWDKATFVNILEKIVPFYEDAVNIQISRAQQAGDQQNYLGCLKEYLTHVPEGYELVTNKVDAYGKGSFSLRHTTNTNATLFDVYFTLVDSANGFSMEVFRIDTKRENDPKARHSFNAIMNHINSTCRLG